MRQRVALDSRTEADETNTPLTTAKIATLAPIPMTSVRMAAIVNSGDRRSDRAAWRRSCAVASNQSARSSRRRRCRSTAVSSRRDAPRSPNSASAYRRALSSDADPSPSVPRHGSRCGTQSRRPRRARCGQPDCAAHAVVQECAARADTTDPPTRLRSGPETDPRRSE